MGASILIYCYTYVWAEDEKRMKRGGRNRSRKEQKQEGTEAGRNRSRKETVIKVKTWESGRFKTWSTTGPSR